MRFYTKPHQFYCGIDLHARSIYVCILDQAGDILAPPEHEGQSGGIPPGHGHRIAPISSWPSSVS